MLADADQIALLTASICTGGRWDPATCRTHQGRCTGRFGHRGLLRRRRWHLWDIHLRFAHGPPPGWDRIVKQFSLPYSGRKKQCLPWGGDGSPQGACPHGGLRPSHPKSTCLTQFTSGPYVVQSWSRNPRKSEAAKPTNSIVWLVPPSDRLYLRHMLGVAAISY